MKTARIAMATLGVGAALTAGAWTLSAAAVPLPADPITIPVVGTSQPFVADPGTADPASDPARAVADAEARLMAINSQLRALVEQQASTVSAATAATASAPTATAPTAPAPTAAQPAAAPPAPLVAAPTTAAPPAHTVTGASGSAPAVGDDAAGDDDESEQQDD